MGYKPPVREFGVARPGLPTPPYLTGMSPFSGSNDPMAGNGIQVKQGLDKITMAMLLMNALGTGFQAYSQANQAKKDREFRERQYNEGGEVRAEGRRRLLQPEIETPGMPQSIYSEQATMPGSSVAAPPPPGPNAERDEELKRILRARLGGQY